MKKATPLSSTTKKKEIAKPIVIKSDEKSKLPLSTKDGKCYHKGFPGGNANEYIQYACDISNYDIDFILTLQHENGSWDYKTQSRVIQKNGKREPSYGFCQMHYSYHKKDVYENLPYDKIFTSKYLNDWKYQMEICRDKYKNGTTFYGYKYRFIGNKGLIYINGKYY